LSACESRVASSTGNASSQRDEDISSCSPWFIYYVRIHTNLWVRDEPSPLSGPMSNSELNAGEKTDYVNRYGKKKIVDFFT
jgi:hypothetical protein